MLPVQPEGPRTRGPASRPAALSRKKGEKRGDEDRRTVLAELWAKHYLRIRLQKKAQMQVPELPHFASERSEDRRGERRRDLPRSHRGAGSFEEQMEQRGG